MKKIVRTFSIVCFMTFAATAFSQISKNMSLLATWSDTTLPNSWTGGAFNDCWGYVGSGGKEYAIIGSTLGHHIFDISTPTSPVLVDFKVGRESSSAAAHRDYKIHQNYLYAVCDEGNSSLQIYDLSYLPDSMHLVYDSQELCATCHNIYIDNGYLYFAGTKDTAGTAFTFRVASLANPTNPVLVNDLSSPPFNYVHDVMVRNDTAFLSCANDGLFIYDYVNHSNPKLISSITNYPEQGYNHSAWVSDNGRYLCFADETHGKGLKLFDIGDILNPTLKSIFRSNLLNDTAQGSIPHNPFFAGNDRIFVSYYHDGVQVFDIQNPNSPTQYGWYDTFLTDTSYAGYGPGCWGVYPYLPSKVVIASDMKNGLFLLDGSGVLGQHEFDVDKGILPIYPNPTTDHFYIDLPENDFQNPSLVIRNQLGQKVKYTSLSSNFAQIDVSGIPPGIYFVMFSDQNLQLVNKLIITR